MKTKIEASDIPELMEFIDANIQKHRLWNNPPHPSGFLLDAMYRGVFRVAGWEYDAGIFEPHRHALRDWIMPIFRVLETICG